jgi:exopolysaccharide biosynthesis polyprenyl glycosylphosphotransferase
MHEDAVTDTLLGDVTDVSPAAAPREVASGIVRAQAPRLRATQARVVAEIGRAGLVCLVLAVVYGSREPMTDRAIVAIALATSIWLVMLKAAAAPEALLLGRFVSQGLGVCGGLVVIGLLNRSSLGLDLAWPWLASAALGVLATAWIWDSVVERVLVARRRVLFVGIDAPYPPLARELERCRDAGFEICSPHSPGPAPGTSAIELVGLEELEQVVDAQQPDIVVLTDERTFDEALDRLLRNRTRVRVASLASFCEYALGCVPIQHITPAWFVSLVHLRQREYSRRSKRVFDILVAVVGLVAAAPLLGLMAVLAKTTAGPALHRQTRVGEGGHLFTVYKIRTMCSDAEHGGAAFACDGDPRVTRVGRILRRSHLDELPQLWNVLRGDMSIVGPRPERPEFIDRIENAVPFWNRRVLVKPGVTGWAQILGDYASDEAGMARKLSYDLWYLRHGSLLMDLAICVRTIGLQFRALIPGARGATR